MLTGMRLVGPAAAQAHAAINQFLHQISSCIRRTGP
jgi:hypothetical protein